MKNHAPISKLDLGISIEDRLDAAVDFTVLSNSIRAAFSFSISCQDWKAFKSYLGI